MKEIIIEFIKVLPAIGWLLIGAFVAKALLPVVAKVINQRKIRIKFGDHELTIEDAVNQLREKLVDAQEQIVSQAKHSAEGVSEAQVRSIKNLRILWIDDRPDENALELSKLAEDGHDIRTAVSSSEARRKLRDLKFDLIISDISRYESGQEKRTAGLDFFRELKEEGQKIPVVFYTSAKGVARTSAEARALGAAGITSSPVKLYQIVDDIQSAQSS